MITTLKLVLWGILIISLYLLATTNVHGDKIEQYPSLIPDDVQ